MEKYYTFLDEHGSADPKTYITDKYFVVTAVLCNPKVKEKITSRLDLLKIKYFGKKSYILHRTELKKDLKKDFFNEEFLNDLTESLNEPFVIFQVIIDKEKAFKKGWITKTVYRRVYRLLLDNIARFSLAKNVRNIIYAEASSVGQDIIIYQNFFHFIANGIPSLNIPPNEIKKHLTSLNFVTKINNDAGEQLADLFSKSGKQMYQLKKKEINQRDLEKFDTLLLEILEKKLFKQPSNCKNKRKMKIYPTINPFEKIL